MPIAECGALLPRNTAVNIDSPHRNFGSPLSASIHRTTAARILPTRSDMPICCGVLALVLERHPRLNEVVLELLADEFTSLVHPQPLDAETTWNHHILHENLS